MKALRWSLMAGVAVCLLGPASVEAGSGKGGRNIAITLDTANPQFGGGATFTVAGPDIGTRSLWLRVHVYQNGVLVQDGYTFLTAGGAVTVQLGPTVRWTGGAADGVAEVLEYNGRSWKLVSNTVRFQIAP